VLIYENWWRKRIWKITSVVDFGKKELTPGFIEAFILRKESKYNNIKDWLNKGSWDLQKLEVDMILAESSIYK